MPAALPAPRLHSAIIYHQRALIYHQHRGAVGRVDGSSQHRRCLALAFLRVTRHGSLQVRQQLPRALRALERRPADRHSRMDRRVRARGGVVKLVHHRRERRDVGRDSDQGGLAQHLAHGHRGRPRHATRRAGGGVARRRDDIGSAQLDLREHVCAVAARVEALVLVSALVGGREEISQAVFQEDRDGGSVHRHADLRCAGNRGDQRFVGVGGPAALLRFALRPRVGCLLQPNLLELLLVVVHQGDV